MARTPRKKTWPPGIEQVVRPMDRPSALPAPQDGRDRPLRLLWVNAFDASHVVPHVGTNAES